MPIDGSFARRACVVAALVAHSSSVQAAAPEEIGALRRELEALRAEQARTAAKIDAVSAAIDRLAPNAPGETAAPSASKPVAAAPVGAPAVVAPPASASPFQVSGDLRLRYETNRNDRQGAYRERGVFRGRLRASYEVLPNLKLGAQLVTGDPDDPNTTDITMSNWDDDFAVSLDQAWLQYSTGDLVLTGGKFALPFRRTDLVWDGDVSPQGIAAAYRLPLGGDIALKATGLFFPIDEVSRGSDSTMAGGQLEFAAKNLSLAAAYYDYRLGSVVGADAGDLRSNLLRPDGRYLSDYNLLDLAASASFAGLGERWPVQVTANYVRNLGAVVSADTGYGIDLFLGRTAKEGDWRFGYGFARAEVDSVLAAFSHDNLDLATNYLQHTLAIDYVPAAKTLLNLTWYHYRALNPRYAGTVDVHNWFDRIRLNLMLSF